MLLYQLPRLKACSGQHHYWARLVALSSWWHEHFFFNCHCRTVYRTNPSNNQLVKDEGAQIFYSIRSQTKPIGIGANCEISHNPSLTMRLQQLEPMTLALIPLVGPCALPIHPTTNWWRMRGHKSFIAFDRRPSPLVLERIVKSLTVTLNYCEAQNDVFNEQKNHIEIWELLSLHWSSFLSWSFPTSTCFFWSPCHFLMLMSKLNLILGLLPWIQEGCSIYLSQTCYFVNSTHLEAYTCKISNHYKSDLWDK